MNKWMMTLAMASLLGGTAMAQGKGEGPQDGSRMADRLTEQMTTRLKLDADQAAKVQDINARYAKELGALRKERKGDKANGEALNNEADRDKVKALSAKNEEELQSVLKPEQMEEWHKMRAELREKRKEHMQERKENMQERKENTMRREGTK